MRLRFIALMVGLLSAEASRAAACSTCRIGDPTANALGYGVPYSGRLRLALAGSWRSERFDEIRLDEGRIDATLVYTPISRLTISLSMPWVVQSFRLPNLARERRSGPGDLALQSRVTMFRDRQLAPRRLVQAIAGFEAPTAPRLEGDSRIPSDVQLGSQSWDALVGASAMFVRGSWTTQLWTLASLPMVREDDALAPYALRSRAVLQWAMLETLWWRAGLEHELEVDDSTDHRLRVGLGVGVKVVPDGLLQLDVGAPLYETDEEHYQGWAAQLTAVWDV